MTWLRRLTTGLSIWALLAAVILHGLVLAPLPLTVRGLAALLLTGLIPGALLVEWLVGGDAAAPLDAWERSLYSVGAGVCVVVVTMLGLSYLPGPILAWQTLAAFDALILALAVAIAVRPPHPAAAAPPNATTMWPPVGDGAPRRWWIAGLITLALVAGGLRLPNLGYSEFQGDETRALLRTAEAIQGYGDALMTHKKGPGEILLPAPTYVLLGHIDEATARLPFTLVNLTGLAAICYLGWRLFGPLAGWTAAMILALDGYFIGFARIVQYQSVVFLLVVLTILVLYRLTRLPARLPRYLTLAAIFLGTALLAHYEGGLAVLPGLYLFYVLWRRGVGPGRLARALLPALVVGAAILAAFYVPFVLHPAFRVTYAYITVNRIGVEWPYNNLVGFFERTTLYNTTYAVILLIAATVGGLAAIYRRTWRGALGWVVTGLIAAGVAVSFARPAWIVIAGHDHTWAFFALALVGAWLLPNFATEERLVWLWFGAPMIFMLFFTLTPNTHVYGFFIGWSLVVGRAVLLAWQWRGARIGVPAARAAGIGLATVLVLVCGNWAVWMFVAAEQETLRTWRENKPAGYWVSYDLPTNMSIFGFPLRNGWKAVGSLIADGVIDAPFDLHGKEPVADWYTRGQGRCIRDHVYYLWHASVEPLEQGYNTVVRQQIEDKGYQLFGEVMVNGAPRLAIYKLTGEPLTPQRFDLADYEARFDAELSGPAFEEQGPTAAPRIQHPLDFHFGNAIKLVGYTLAGQDNAPGGGVSLTLYWQATAPVPAAYSVFTQVIDRADDYKAGQRDGEPGCNLFPTDAWQPGDIIADRYYIPLAGDARPGTYTMLIGMYDREADVRLPITTPDGAPVGDSLGIDEVRIGAP